MSAPPAPGPPAPGSAVIAAPLLWGLLPAGSYAGRSQSLLLRSATASRRAWLAFVSGFFEPVFYLVAMGQGLGSLVGTLPGPDGAPISYAAFIAPGLLAASAMNGAVFDSTYNVFFKLKYSRLYDAMLATPLGPVDIALGEIGWALIRGGLYALGFLTVMGGFGLLVSPWTLLALPAALLVAFAFAAVGMAATSFMRSWQDFDLVTLAVLPMFLFSTTFYPLSVYPRWLQIVVECLPLYHAVELMRGLTTGAVHTAMFGHLAYFLVMIVLGTVVAARRLDALLLR
jgi:lipooligosaccharide transport system permease protein